MKSENKKNKIQLNVLKAKFDIVEEDKSKEKDLTLSKQKKQKTAKEIIDDSSFLDLLEDFSKQSFSFSLEKTGIAASASRATDLERTAQQGQISSAGNEKNDPFKYNSSTSADLGAPRYAYLRDEDARIIASVRENPLDFRREKSFETRTQEVNRSEFFSDKGFKSQNIETYVPVKDFNKGKIPKEDAFAKQNIKYSPSEN